MVLLQRIHLTTIIMHSDIHGHKPIVWLISSGMLLIVLDPLSLFEHH